MAFNIAAIGAAAVVAFAISSAWYVVFGGQRAALSPGLQGVAADARPSAWKVGVELLRSLVLAAVLAGLASRIGVADWTGALLLGLSAWVGFCLTMWVGAVVWENTPWRLAAIHAGDWLVKVLAIAVIVGVWR
jgi:hypothetical protein